MKSILRYLFSGAIIIAFFHFNLVGCQIQNVKSDDKRVDNAYETEIVTLTENSDVYHDKDVVVTGIVQSVGTIVYKTFFIKQYVLVTDEDLTITVFVADGESVPNLGRQLKVFGRFKQCSNYQKFGLACAIREYHRKVLDEDLMVFN